MEKDKVSLDLDKINCINAYRDIDYGRHPEDPMSSVIRCSVKYKNFIFFKHYLRCSPEKAKLCEIREKELHGTTNNHDNQDRFRA